MFYSKKKFNSNTQITTGVALLSTILFLFPIYWMIVTSLKPMTEILATPPHLYPHNPSLKPYIDNFIRDSSLYKYIINSVIIAAGSLTFTLIIATPFAYALARLNFAGKGIISIFLLSIQMLPNIMMAMPLYILFSKIHFINSYPSLIVANMTHAVPFAILMLRPHFLSAPFGLEEAAYIDGCNKFSAFLKIILPCIRPGILTVGAFVFLYAWKDFLFALIFTTDKSIHPLTMGIYRFITEYGARWNDLMAVATIAAIPVIVIFILLQKHIVGGLTAGSMK